MSEIPQTYRGKRLAHAWTYRSPEGEPLGYAALESMLAEESPDGSPREWLLRLFDRVQKRSGRAPEDDWTAALLAPGEREPKP